MGAADLGLWLIGKQGQQVLSLLFCEAVQESFVVIFTSAGNENKGVAVIELTASYSPPE